MKLCILTIFSCVFVVYSAPDLFWPSYGVPDGFHAVSVNDTRLRKMFDDFRQEITDKISKSYPQQAATFAKRSYVKFQTAAARENKFTGPDFYAQFNAIDDGGYHCDVAVNMTIEYQRFPENALDPCFGAGACQPRLDVTLGFWCFI